MNRILLVESDVEERSTLQAILEANQYSIATASTVTEATENHCLPEFDLLITDIALPDQDGTDLINLAQGVPVMVITHHASMRSAVNAMKMGAVDYIAKPFDQSELIKVVNANIGKKPTKSKVHHIDTESADSKIRQLIYGQCESMRKVFNLMKKVAPTEATVLIQGETGTGKELAARAIHQLSVRQNKEYICINCAAIPETLIESELFGHEKGAFTGAVSARSGLIEAADGGTLFLDEIGELPHEAQARLLRVLQEGEIRRVGSTQSKKVDVRLIAATHRNLKALCRSGKFREDLYYRLNVVQLKLPPLRERGEDILGLAKTLLKKSINKLGKEDVALKPDAMKAIQEYHWPGNVRELENAIERGCILCDDNMISASILDIESEVDEINIPQGLITPSQNASQAQAKSQGNQTLSMEDYFQKFVLENQDRMSETELAQRLGISRKSLWERRQRLGIPRRKA